MKTEKEGKMKICSILCAGFFIGFSFLPGIVGQANAQPFGMTQQSAPVQPVIQCLTSVGGRFAFGQISDSSKDKFMLDTVTGRLWRISESGEIGIFLSPVPYRTKGGKCTFLPDEVPLPKKK
jgi:hypothetical protein